MKILYRQFLLLSFLLFALSVGANTKVELKRIEPMNWWVGMKNTNLQLLVNGPNISACDVRINYPGVSLTSVSKVESPNYLFADLVISPKAVAGSFDIVFSVNGKNVAVYKYQLLNRAVGSAQRVGFNSSDAMYLVMPDRFANGDPSNDNVHGYLETANRSEPFGRHGGDLKGISDNLNYITNLGFTALWLNPVLENNLSKTSYHGYAITDFYNVDARFGTNQDFKALTEKCKKNGVKMVMDMVFNHCGINHWWMSDLPMGDWINQWPTFTRSNYRLSTICAPNGSVYDKDLAVKGWFDNPMPDLNLQNKYLCTYFTQNSIWWTEYAGLEGIRIDTYPYPDRVGMSKLCAGIMDEYPNFNIVGECWISSTAKVAYYQSEFPHKDGFDSHLPTVMDFPLHNGLYEAFIEKPSWENGMIRLYDIFAEDFLYANPDNVLVFPDNHDVTRVFSVLKENVKELKMVIALMSTVRGIPQFYYGTELVMTGDGSDHASLRVDFPGGWRGDSISSFTAKGRTPVQNEVFDYMSKLLNYRRNEPVLHTGKFVQFLPQDEVYVYSRSGDDKAIVVFMNNNDSTSKTVDTARYAEIMGQFKNAKDIITDKKIANLSLIEVPAKSALIIELTK